MKLRKFVIWYIEGESLLFTEGYSEDVLSAVTEFCELGHDVKNIISIYIPLEDRDSI